VGSIKLILITIILSVLLAGCAAINTDLPVEDWSGQTGESSFHNRIEDWQNRQNAEYESD